MPPPPLPPSPHRNYPEHGAHKDQLQVERTKRIQRQTLQTSDSYSGTYLPPSRIVKKEGADSQAVVAACRYIRQCVLRAQRGETLNGRPYMQYNAWTGRHEFLYCQRQYGETLKSSWTQEYHEAERVAPSVAQIESREGPGNASNSELGRKPGTKQDEGAKKGQKRAATEASPNPTDKTKKFVEAQWTKSRQLRTRRDSAANTCNMVLRSIETEADWAWATAPALTKDLRDAKQALEIMMEGAFWASWSMMPNFSQSARKRFDETVIAEDLGKLPRLEKAIAQIEKSAKIILDMHAARK